MVIIHNIEFLLRKSLLTIGLLLIIFSWTTATANYFDYPYFFYFDSMSPENSSISNPSDSILRLSFQPENGDFDESNPIRSAALLANNTVSLGTSSFEVMAYPYFNKVYTGNGVDHMNINLVNLSQTGLAVGDEIGIFDGNYCVGDAVISDTDMGENTISIPASANDTVEYQPNGFIEGHTIAMKLYRAGTVYLLYFQTVNNTTNIFERSGSMFALVDFSQSADEITPNKEETVKLYPNPFENQLIIQIILPSEMPLEVKIYDQQGTLIRSLYSGETSGQLTLKWDGKDDRKNSVPSGTYFCKINNNTTKILYKHYY